MGPLAHRPYLHLCRGDVKFPVFTIFWRNLGLIWSTDPHV
ncbi:hypothetical protein LSAT2_012385 [Lamellibrachia satsuma]|nr:hypothetical protein LSAT2_012385 [Lamellibrachia satsuma]